jgi:hypothetical protein
MGLEIEEKAAKLTNDDLMLVVLLLFILCEVATVKD